MMGLPTNTEFRVSKQPFPADILAELPDETERQNVAETSARDDTVTLTLTDIDKGKLFAYVVFGRDDHEWLTLYAARVIGGGMFGPMALKAMFGVSQIIGTPMAVHCDRVAAFARTIGAEQAFKDFDTDGIPMGVFHGQ